MNKTLLALIVAGTTAAGGAVGYIGVKRAATPPPKNKTIAFVLAVEPGAECEESALLSKAAERMTGEKRDAAVCLIDSSMFRCIAGAKLGDKPDCQPIGDFRSDAEKAKAKADADAKAKADADAKAKAEAEARAKADADAKAKAAAQGSGSGAPAPTP